MATDFWGIAVPNWIGAAGGLAATALAVYSLVVAGRSKRTADAAQDEARGAGDTAEVVRGALSESLRDWQQTSDGAESPPHAPERSSVAGTRSDAARAQDERAARERRRAEILESLERAARRDGRPTWPTDRAP